MSRRKIKGNINPTYIFGTSENRSLTDLYPNDCSSDCTDPTWQSLIRIKRNNPNSKLQQAKEKARLFREILAKSRGS